MLTALTIVSAINADPCSKPEIFQNGVEKWVKLSQINLN